MLSTEAVIIIRSQITEWNALHQNMVDGDEHGMGHGYGRPVLSASGRNALILGREIRTLSSAGHLGALHQHGFQRLIPLACFAVIPLPGTLVVTRANASPGAQMCRRGEAAHIYARLRLNDLRAAPAIPGIWQTSAMDGWKYAMYVSTIQSSS